jgi:multiple sugar transport system permease protein
MKISRNRKISFIQYGVLFIIAFCFLIPILWIVSASLDARAGETIRLPRIFTLDNYKNVLMNPKNLKGFWNSFVIATLSSSVVVAASILAAYPLSRYQMKIKKYFMLTIIFMTALPANAVIVPVFRLFISAGIHDSLVSTSLLLAASRMPYAIWMMKNFMDSVPITLEESAWIDGASAIQSIIRIIAPLMMPGMVTVFIYCFSGAWGTFFAPFILLQDPGKIPAAVRIYQFFVYDGMIEYGRLAAYSLIYTMPCVVLYGYSQKYMSLGFAMGGADKG